MMVRDTAQYHHEHQQREERYRNDQVPNWLTFMHVTKIGPTRNRYHIRRWLVGANSLCREPGQSSGYSPLRLASSLKKFSAV